MTIKVQYALFSREKKLPDAIFFGVFSVSQFVLVIFRSLNSIHIGLFDASFTFSFFFHFIRCNRFLFKYKTILSFNVSFNSGFDYEDQNYDNLKNK